MRVFPTHFPMETAFIAVMFVAVIGMTVCNAMLIHTVLRLTILYKAENIAEYKSAVESPKPKPKPVKEPDEVEIPLFD